MLADNNALDTAEATRSTALSQAMAEHKEALGMYSSVVQ